jgi:3-isopropylmalate/(R)-2-methylmalate dehydratase large subunit
VSGRTLFDKLWERHVVEELEGGVSLLHIDRHYLHDLEAGPGLERLAKNGYRVHDPGLTFATPDHTVPTGPDGPRTDRQAALMRQLRERTAEAGIRLFDVGEHGHGIVHVMAPELGLTLPGMTVACPDSHTCTHGGLGALGLAIGSSEVAHVLATQTLRQRRPKTMRITYTGRPASGVTAKDVILGTIGALGTQAGRGHAVEYAGDPIDDLTVDERLTFCNLSIELGARIGLIGPDETTFAYLDGREYAPRGDLFARAVADWRALASEPDAAFDTEHAIDAGAIAPQITWGTSPQDVIGVDGTIPDPADEPDPQRRRRMADALDYMGLSPGRELAGTPVEWVFIGSCTNARLSDLRAAAAVLGGRRVAAGVRAWVVPGSEDTKRAAEAEGLDEVFRDAGFEWRLPGCSMCLAANGDAVPPGERSVSTTNRNFVGRQGPGARTHLASPQSAVAAAVAGVIADPRRL